MIIAGIDPGKTGALAIYDTCFKTIETFSVPTHKLDGKINPSYDKWSDEWISALSNHLPEAIYIEAVHAMPKQGVTSVFNFGKFYGFALGLVYGTCSYASINFVSPQKWKKSLTLINQNKNASREKAKLLMPSIAAKIQKAKDDGIAEAALIAYYGSLLQGED